MQHLVAGHNGKANLTPPPSWKWAHNRAHLNSVFKPLPARLHCDDGFQPMVDTVQVLQNAGRGAMHTFTREFWHLVTWTKGVFRQNRRKNSHSCGRTMTGDSLHPLSAVPGPTDQRIPSAIPYGGLVFVTSLVGG